MDVMVRVLVPGLDAAGFVGAQGRAMLVAAAPAAAAAVHAYFVRVPATGEPAARPAAAAPEEGRGRSRCGAARGGVRAEGGEKREEVVDVDAAVAVDVLAVGAGGAELAKELQEVVDVDLRVDNDNSARVRSRRASQSPAHKQQEESRAHRSVAVDIRSAAPHKGGE